MCSLLVLKPNSSCVLCLSFYDWDGVHVSEVYNNTRNLDSGDDVVLAESVTVSNINISLDEYASLAGTVTQVGGVTPVAGVGRAILTT